MAEAAIEKIKKDILSCCICSDELRDPIGLPCLHGFCYECLNTWHQASRDKTHVVCPSCKKSAPVPEGGIRDFPRHDLVKDITDTINMEPAVEAKRTSCHICGKNPEVHCVDCSKSLCPQCHTNHDAFMKDHHIVTLEDLNQGQVTLEGRFCKTHGDVQVRYYCETENKQVCMDCISLKTCPIEHERVSLKEAAQKQTILIDELRKKCEKGEQMFEDAVIEADVVLSNLTDSVKQTKTDILKHKKQYIQKVEQLYDKQMDEAEQVHRSREKLVDDQKKALGAHIDKFKRVVSEASCVAELKSDFSITYQYSSMSTALNELSEVIPEEIDRSLGFLRYESGISVCTPSVGYLLQRERWKLAGTFSTELEKPLGIALNHDGDIAVTSYVSGVKVFSRNGQVKCSFMEDCTKITDIAVSHDNRYIVANGCDFKGLQFHTKDGKFLSNVPVSNASGGRSNLNSVAVDANGLIIGGLVGNTISIHYSDGSLISKFATTYNCPFRIVSASEGEIICLYYHDHKARSSLELIEYSGSNIRVINPPPVVEKWKTGHLCCRQGEVFVSNPRTNGSCDIFRYTPTGQYLSCVTTEVKQPQGMALSQDGMELYVVDRDDCQVKIFHKE